MNLQGLNLNIKPFSGEGEFLRGRELNTKLTSTGVRVGDHKVYFSLASKLGENPSKCLTSFLQLTEGKEGYWK